MDGRTVYIGTCEGGVHAYHVHLEGPDVIVSVNAVGDGRMGEQLRTPCPTDGGGPRRRVSSNAMTADRPPAAGARPVRAPRGTELSCRGWGQEAALRMLMNNLDPEVAEDPDAPRRLRRDRRAAARAGRRSTRSSASCARLADDETLLVQSGKPVGGRSGPIEWAPRVLIANSNLVGKWATWDVFRELERQGLTMYGQMTAGSWIYIGTPGDPAGHVRDVRRARAPALRRHAARDA